MRDWAYDHDQPVTEPAAVLDVEHGEWWAVTLTVRELLRRVHALSFLAVERAGQFYARFATAPETAARDSGWGVDVSTDRTRAFDSHGFFLALNAARESRDVTWKELASQAGVSASTLTRVGQGKRPDVDSFAALVAWAGLKPGDFIAGTPGASEPLAEIAVLLRRDPHLNDDAAAALDELLKATYKRLRTE